MDKIKYLGLCEQLDEILDIRENTIGINNSKKIDLIVQMINIEFKIFNILISEAMFKSFDYIIFQAIYKNIFSLYICLSLLKRGLYGYANSNYRNIIEYLLIIKFIMTTNSKKIYERWKKGSNISISQDILRKILFPHFEKFKILWADSCKWTHGTIYSGHILEKNDYKTENYKGSLNVLIMLLIMNYHCLTKCVYNHPLSFLKRYNESTWNEYCNLKKDFNAIKRKLTRGLSQFDKQIINEYTSKWKF